MGGSHSGSMKKRDVDDLKDLTNFSGSEIREWYDRFHEEYPAGVITEEEFGQMYEELFPDGDPSRFAGRVFKVRCLIIKVQSLQVPFIRYAIMLQKSSHQEQFLTAFNIIDSVYRPSGFMGIYWNLTF